MHHDSVLVKPINTPITPLCTGLTTLTWEHVRNAGSLRDAVFKLDSFLQEYVLQKKLEFTFVTMNSWELRMKLPKESRERSIMLPPYLELSRYFDLKKEYLKYLEASHPELSQTSNPPSVSQILSQLNIQLSSLKPSTPALQTPFLWNSPKRASDEVQIMTSILKALIPNLPANSPVFKQPHDLHLDLKQFFQEKSKILYMSNLPIDTTQSELESWFTQFGGRPIAFWTLKNSNDSQNNVNNNNGNINNSGNNGVKPTTNGFAIFGTHDEAVDSLSMNGRLLTDRTIEVQPSSVRVLDRSQEILTPFPSSKNRPRPGDWTCPSCGFSNFQRRTACFRCSFPAASAAAIQESMYSNKSSTMSSFGQQQPHHQHNQNHHHQHRQQHQHSLNHLQSDVNHQQPNQVDLNLFNNGMTQNAHHHHHHHHNGHQNGLNHPLQQQQNRTTSTVPFRAGDWKCDMCLYHNFAKNICCLKCGSPRNNNTNGRLQHNSNGVLQSNTSQNNLYYVNSSLPSQLSSQQQYSQLPTPTSSTTNSATLLTPTFMQSQPLHDLMINQINNLSLNNSLYRTSTGSTNGNNSSGNLISSQFRSNEILKKSDEI